MSTLFLCPFMHWLLSLAVHPHTHNFWWQKMEYEQKKNCKINFIMIISVLKNSTAAHYNLHTFMWMYNVYMSIHDDRWGFPLPFLFIFPSHFFLKHSLLDFLDWRVVWLSIWLTGCWILDNFLISNNWAKFKGYLE